MGFRLFALSSAILGFRVRAWGVLGLRGAAGGLCRASSNQASVKKGFRGVYGSCAESERSSPLP